MALVLGTVAAWAATTVRVRGSQVTSQYTLALGAAYQTGHPEVSVDVSATGKDAGLIQLAMGSADIVNSAMSLKDQDRADVLAAIASAEARGVVFTEVAAAIDPVMFCVNPSNPVRSLTFDQLRGIYTGTIVNWKEVGGDDRTITVWISDYDQDHKMHVVSRDLLQGLSPATGARIDANGKGMLTQVSNDVSAIGYDSRFYCLADLRDNPAKRFVMLDLGPAETPTAESPSRKFPVARYVWAIYRKSDISAAAQDFLAFTLSPEGQRIIASNDVLPNNGPNRVFELVQWDGGAYGVLASADENLSADTKIHGSSAAAGTIYVRNNTKYDALSVDLKSASGQAKSLEIRGTLSDPTFSSDRFPYGEVTVISIDNPATGDSLRFSLGGRQVTMALDGGETGHSSGGCDLGLFGPVAVMGMLPLLFLVRRK
jgi:phosphate transport system substrate-binding protein